VGGEPDVGTRANVRLATHRRALAVTFASVVIGVGLYVVASGVTKLFASG